MNVFRLIAESPLWSQPPLVILANLVSWVAFVVIGAAVVADFKNYYRQDREVVGSDRSFVETGSMTAFFIAYYLVIRLNLGGLTLGSSVRQWAMAIGVVLVVLGVVVNVWGRVVLSSAWANQIKIYEGQHLRTTGPFAVVRHPLYASLIWAFTGGSLIYANWLSLAFTLLVFIPMMYVRGRKEDAVLAQVFGDEYSAYRGRAWMFLPKPWR